MLRLLVLRVHTFFAAVLSVGTGLCTLFLSVQPVGAGLLLDGNTLFRMGEKENLCAITFDDGPSQHTAQLLDILRDYKIPATFFVLGTQVDRRPQLITRMQTEGHEVANHTTTHVTLRHLPIEKQRAELKQVQETLLALGTASKYLRPPFGRYDANTLAIAKELGLRVAMWSVDSFDWKRQAAMTNMRSVAGGPTLRGVFLFHDTHKPTVLAMPTLLTELAANGCRFVTLSDFMAAGEASSVPISPAPPVPGAPAVPGAPGLAPQTPSTAPVSDGTQVPAGTTAPAGTPANGAVPTAKAPPSEPSPHWAISASPLAAQAAAWVTARPAVGPAPASTEEGFWPFFKNSQHFRGIASFVEQVFAD